MPSKCGASSSCFHHPEQLQTCNSSEVLVALWLAIPLPRRVEIIGTLGTVRSLSYSVGKRLEPPGIEERENLADTVQVQLLQQTLRGGTGNICLIQMPFCVSVP